MKHLIAAILILTMALSLAACGGGSGEAQGQVEITRATEAAEAEAVFSLNYQGLELIPGSAFDPAALPEAESVYEVPSCAIEGTDNVYSYGAMEVTAFDDGSGENIYSIYLMDSAVKTDEGLAVGDPEARVAELYGQDHQGSENEYVYVKGETELHILIQDGLVLSIELRKAI